MLTIKDFPNIGQEYWMWDSHYGVINKQSIKKRKLYSVNWDPETDQLEFGCASPFEGMYSHCSKKHPLTGEVII